MPSQQVAQVMVLQSSDLYLSLSLPNRQTKFVAQLQLEELLNLGGVKMPQSFLFQQLQSVVV